MTTGMVQIAFYVPNRTKQQLKTVVAAKGQTITTLFRKFTDETIAKSLKTKKRKS